MTNKVRVVPNGELEAGPSTGGMVRNSAFAAENLWVGEVHTTPGMISDWHHHGEYTTYGYVVSGMLRIEFGPGGGETVEAGPGDFFMVPPHTVHREANPGSQEQVLVGVRLGTGPTVTNVGAPEPSRGV